MFLEHGHKIHEVAGRGKEEPSAFVQYRTGGTAAELRATDGKKILAIIAVEFEEGDGLENEDLIPAVAIRDLLKGNRRNGVKLRIRRVGNQGRVEASKVREHQVPEVVGTWALGGADMAPTVNLGVLVVKPTEADCVLRISPRQLLELARGLDSAEVVELRWAPSDPGEGTRLPVQVIPGKGSARGVIIPMGETEGR